MPNMTKRTIAVAAAAAIALTAFEMTPAMATPVNQVPAPLDRVTAMKPAGDVGATEFSARRKHRRHHSGAAVAGAAVAIFGTIAAIAAERAARKRYERYHYGYPYYGAPYGPYYGGARRYYRYH